MECLSDKQFPETLQRVATLIHSSVNNMPIAAFGSRSLEDGAHPPPSGIAVRGASYVHLLELRHFRWNVPRLCGKQETIRFERFTVYLFERRDIVIPFKKGGGRSASLDGAGVQPPYRIKDGMIVRVKRVLLKSRVPGEVNLSDALGGDTVHVLRWVEVVILRRNIDVIYVEHDAAVGRVNHFV